MLSKCLQVVYMLALIISGDLTAKTIFIGIAGGTGSGKTTLAQKIFETFPDSAVVVEEDSYYRDLSHLTKEERENQNFDHPKAIDFDLLCKHLIDLREGKSIHTPIYNFKSHSRELETEEVQPARIIIVDGILLFSMSNMRDLFDLKIYVDTDSDLRLMRRMERDIQERGRTFEGVKKQYFTSVKPMHAEFVEPSKYYADIIVPGGNNTSVAMDLIVSKLNLHLQEP